MTSIKTIVKVALSLGLTAFFLWSAFRTVDIAHVIQILREADLTWLLASPVMIILSCYPRARRWKILMEPVLPGTSVRKIFMAIVIGYAGNNLVPRAGEIARIWAIERDPQKLSGLAATVAVERLLDLITMMIVFGLMTFALRGRLSEAFPQFEGVATPATIVIALAVVLVLVASIYGNLMLDALGRRFPKFSQSRIMGLLRSFLQGMEAVRMPGSYFGIFLWTFLLNFIYVLSVYLPFFAFGFDERFNLGLIDALTVLTIATIGIIIPTPGGAGTYHYFCSLAKNSLYAIPLEEAVAFATVVHALVYLSFLFVGGPGLMSLLWNRRQPQAS